MGERKKARQQITNKNIRRLNREGLSIKEISKIVGKSELHVRNTIKRDPDENN